MGGILSKHRISFAILLILLIMIGEFTFHHFGLPAWPALMVMVFFFLAHGDVLQIKNILAGGVFGLVCVTLMGLTVAAVGAQMGIFEAKMLFVAIFVASIVLLKDTIPLLFNDYAFMFYLVSANIAGAAVSAGGAPSGVVLLIAIQLLGGAFFIAGILGIKKILEPLAADDTIEIHHN